MDINGTNFRLEEFRRRASYSELKIIDYILSDVDHAAGLPIRELSDATQTSVSTILRLSKKLGYDGYRSFQQALIYELAIRRRNAHASMGDVKPTDTTLATINKITNKSIKALDTTAQIIDPSAIEACVDRIDSASSVNLFGIGASLLVAKDLQLKLLRAAVPCNCCDDWQLQLLYAKNMTPDDLAIAISYSGMSREVITCAKRAKETGATVVAITSMGVNTPLLKYTDIVLGVAASEHGIRAGAMASRIAQLNVVDILFSAYSNKHWETVPYLYVKNAFDHED